MAKEKIPNLIPSEITKQIRQKDYSMKDSEDYKKFAGNFDVDRFIENEKKI